MPCFYCGKRVSLVRQLNEPDFCCDEHRARYHDLTRLALGRLLETRERLTPPAPKRRAKSVEEAETHRPPRRLQPEPAEPELAGFQPEAAVEYTPRDNPFVTTPEDPQPASVAFPELPPEEAGFNLALGTLVRERPMGRPSIKPRRDPASEALAMPVPGAGFPRSNLPAATGHFPTGGFKALAAASARSGGGTLRAAQRIPERGLPWLFPAASARGPARISGLAGPVGGLCPRPLEPTARAQAAARAYFAAPRVVCPAAIQPSLAFTVHAPFAADSPVQAKAPALPRETQKAPRPFSFTAALPHAEMRARLGTVLAPQDRIGFASRLQATPPAHAPSDRALELLPIAAAPLRLPPPSAPRACAAALEAASFTARSGGVLPSSSGTLTGVPGSLFQRTTEIPEFAAGPVARALTCAPARPWPAPPAKDSPGKRLASGPAAGVPDPAWPDVAIARPAAPRAADALASPVAEPVGFRHAPRKMDGAATIGTQGLTIPEAVRPVHPASGVAAQQRLMPLQAPQPEPSARSVPPRVCAAAEMAGPEAALPDFHAPAGPRAIASCELARPGAAASPAAMPAVDRTALHTIPLGLTCPLAFPAPAPAAFRTRGLGFAGSLAPNPPKAQTAKIQPATSPAGLPAAGLQCPEASPAAPECKPGRTPAIPYAIVPAVRSSPGRAVGFACPPPVPALPGARALAGLTRLAGVEARPLAAAPAILRSKPAGRGWEAASPAIRLPLAPTAVSSGAVHPPAGIFPIAGPGTGRHLVSMREKAWAPFPEPAILQPQLAGRACGLSSSPARAAGRPEPLNPPAAARPAPAPPPVRKVNRQPLVPAMRSAITAARMLRGFFHPLEVPDFDDEKTIHIGAGYPAAGPGPAIPPLRLGPECADSLQPAAFAAAPLAPAAGVAVTRQSQAGALFRPRPTSLPQPATRLFEFDFYAMAAPRERGWSLVSSVFKVVLFCMALPPVTEPPGAGMPAAGFEGVSTHAVEQDAGRPARGAVDITARLTQ